MYRWLQTLVDGVREIHVRFTDLGTVAQMKCSTDNEKKTTFSVSLYFEVMSEEFINDEEMLEIHREIKKRIKNLLDIKRGSGE